MGNRPDIDWFKDLKWGVFTHYLGENDQPAEDWDRQVAEFDVEGLAEQLSSVGAPYYFMTIGQNSGHYCSPNKVYDEIVGRKPSKCSQRDLISDLYDALSKRGIELLVYLPCGAPEHDSEATEKFEWYENPQREHWNTANGLDENGQPWGSKNARLASFQFKWNAVIEEWSKRWGKKVRGWWFDGCYFNKAMYLHDTEPNITNFAAAAKAGNPESILAFNPGVDQFPLSSQMAQEDYIAGEVNKSLPEVFERWVNDSQLHILSFLGNTWGAGTPRFTDELVAAYTKYVSLHEGVVTWDVPIQRNGLIPEAFIEQLKFISDSVSK
ncbi:MAG: alpha-L-fucosidase [Sedimentisphaeraceae bacterium JB056]